MSSKPRISDLRSQFYAESDLLSESYKSGSLTYPQYRKLADELEAKHSESIARARGQARFWNCLTYRWESVSIEAALKGTK